MPQIVVTNRQNQERTVSVSLGMTVMEAIRDSGFDELLALCGGACSCATCHVYVDAGFAGLVPAITDHEEGLLDSSSHRKAASRLSCQIRLSDRLDGLRVTIAPSD